MQLAAAFSIQDIFSPANIYGGTDTEVTGFGQLASDIVLILTGVAFATSIIFIIIAGIKIVTASGDEKKLASATGTLTYAIIGLVVTILAFVIVRLVQYFIGANMAI
ncbi:hypothetical protein A3A60_02960 [Candidatus Curtissbacteria bacterium RIFCSPLOWO2_01_FULL_42_26]|uniref:Uncharacterized protein n=1 Tax=Candidatus Curtissbacteria bacterium RIFCSPLOWO2_01_FULL_42_26 TaxID=1797729 RepID=A0A1F5I2I8_9BACT|nr:MAG: hypothetical protein A3A60_02960 [Candidatus Curtissbacteria bacterium RIFCSPLOWO2_01_FULL_42_26]